MIAIVPEDGPTLTYAELADLTDGFSHRLGPVKRLILVQALNSTETIIAYLAALAGGHAVILSAEINDALVSTFMPDAIYRLGVDGWHLSLEKPEGGLHPDLALLLSTSGTTGATKLVRLSLAAVEANARSIADYLGIAAGSCALTTLPLHYSYGLSVINSHLLAGGTILLTGRSIVDPALWSFCEENGGTSFAGVPYSFELLDRIGFWDRCPASLNTITQAGGRMPPEMVGRIGSWADEKGIRFFVMYGQTEATARIAYLPPERLREAPDCIGVPIPGGVLALQRPDGHIIEAANEEGELVYTGPNVMMGYALGRSDLAHGSEIEHLATGDLAIRTDDGLFRIVGRTSRICKPFGLRVSLDEVEAICAKMGLAVAVAGSDDCIAIANARDVDPHGLTSELAALFKLPETIFVVLHYTELPRLTNGKTDYKAILKDALEKRGSVAAPTDAKDPLHLAFARMFPNRAISDETSFLELAGDSLTYVQLSMELETILGYLPDEWEGLSITTLRSLASSNGKTAKSWLSRISSEIVLRALAVIAVIVNHLSSYQTGGGSDVLLLLVGYSLARFQSGRFIAGRGHQVIGRLFVRVMLPYLLILLAYSVLRRPVPIENFFLGGNLFGRAGGFLEPFWFLDVLFQINLLFLLIFLFPHVRRLADANPFTFGVWMMAAGFVVKFGAILLFDHAASHYNRTPDAVFLLVAIGWSIWFAKTARQRLMVLAISLVLAALTAGFVPALDFWSVIHPSIGEMRATWLIAATLVLIYISNILLPFYASRIISSISSSAYYIYISHGIVVYLVIVHFQTLPLGISIAAACILGILIGQIVMRTARAVEMVRAPGSGRR